MKYKVGDKVKVKSDLKCKEYYGGVPFTSEMNRFKGTEITIAKTRISRRKFIFMNQDCMEDSALHHLEVKLILIH